MNPISIEANKYVVFDVETNGLKSKEDDLLSISFYKPDEEKSYERFLPLELSRHVKTTQYNGITDEDLKNASPLSQDEFDDLISEFELDSRIILTYSGRKFDEVFLREYLKRKGIRGFERLTFYNFKKQLISSRFSGGNVTKDNLCNMFGISNVQKIHTASNDCRLEWELFKKLNGHHFLITEGDMKDNVFEFSSDYIIPVSLFSSHPNIKNVVENFPYIQCNSQEIKTFEISSKEIKHLGTNFDGMVIEHLINCMLNVKKIDSREFLLENKKKLSFVGKIPSSYESVPMSFNLDGTVTAIQPAHKKIEKTINDEVIILKERLQPIVDYIANDIFECHAISSQELVVNDDYNVLALCDLSTDKAVLEIKTNSSPSENYKEQLFFEARGRDCYHLRMIWDYHIEKVVSKTLKFIIHKVNVEIGDPPVKNWSQGRLEQRRQKTEKILREKIAPQNITLVSFLKSTEPVKLSCNVCGNEWNMRYQKVLTAENLCPVCHPKISQSRNYQRKYASPEERVEAKAEKFYSKISEASGGTITASGYIGSRDKVFAECLKCGFKWETRADHLISRCKCKKCNKL